MLEDSRNRSIARKVIMVQGFGILQVLAYYLPEKRASGRYGKRYWRRAAVMSKSIGIVLAIFENKRQIAEE